MQGTRASSRTGSTGEPRPTPNRWISDLTQQDLSAAIAAADAGPEDFSAFVQSLPPRGD